MIGDRRDEQAAGHAALLTRANFADELPEFSTKTKPGNASLAGALARSGHLRGAPRAGPSLDRLSACKPTGMP
jgi:hypothetical protein